MTEADTLKRRAAERAVQFVESGMTVGLGTGSTARHVVDVLRERLESGALRDVRGVPTSEATRRHAESSGIPLVELGVAGRCDVTIDGADEVDPRLNLIKGLGAALLWEKIVARNSERLVIVADGSKLVERLGERAPVPVEVVPFGWQVHLPFLESLGARPRVREGAGGDPLRTDGGHFIVDCGFDGGVPDPFRFEAEASARTGIVETGLFLAMASAVVVAEAAGVRVLEPDHG